jgi:hypothetical protein
VPPLVRSHGVDHVEHHLGNHWRTQTNNHKRPTPLSLHIVNTLLERTLYIVSLLIVFILRMFFFFKYQNYIVIALLGIELARKTFHCTCDIKTWN